jgi:hypothetical protein
LHRLALLTLRRAEKPSNDAPERSNSYISASFSATL